MKSFYILISFFLVMFFSFVRLNGQSEFPDIQNTKISILTCRSGDELYSTFGHTAIRIYNSKSKFDIIYNYGVFSFNTPNFYVKFMRGKLPYYLGYTKTEYFLRDYNFEKRTVIEQELTLNNNQKKEIIQFLIENAKPENREYKYDFFYDNCATRVVDVFNHVADIDYSNFVEQKTFRDLLKENLQSLVWSDFGIDLVIGARADRLADRRGQLFLPEYVMANLSSASIGDSTRLVKSSHLVLDFESLNQLRKNKSTNWPLVCTTLLFLLTLILNLVNVRFIKVYNKTLLIFCGMVSLLILFLWFGTDHKATRDNWNLMWLNPLIPIYYFTNIKVKNVLYYVVFVLLGIAGLNCAYTFLPQFFNIAFLPIILSIAVAFYYEHQSRNRNSGIA